MQASTSSSQTENVIVSVLENVAVTRRLSVAVGFIQENMNVSAQKVTMVMVSRVVAKVMKYSILKEIHSL